MVDTSKYKTPMRVRDRERILRFYTLLNAPPPPPTGAGTKTASMAGFADFAAEMAEMKVPINDFLLAMSAQGYGELEEDYYSPDFYLDVLEAWIEERRKVQWERPIISYSEVYARFLAKKEKDSHGYLPPEL